MDTIFRVWTWWRTDDIFYTIYELNNYFYFSEAKIEEIKKTVELLKPKPKIFSKEWLRKWFNKKGK